MSDISRTQIYNEQVDDLLKGTQGLRLRQAEDNDWIVEGLSWFQCTTPQFLLQVRTAGYREAELSQRSRAREGRKLLTRATVLTWSFFASVFLSPRAVLPERPQAPQLRRDEYEQALVPVRPPLSIHENKQPETKQGTQLVPGPLILRPRPTSSHAVLQLRMTKMARPRDGPASAEVRRAHRN